MRVHINWLSVMGSPPKYQELPLSIPHPLNLRYCLTLKLWPETVPPKEVWPPGPRMFLGVYSNIKVSLNGAMPIARI